MTKLEKQAIVEKLAQELASASCFYVVDSTYLSVADINQFRRKCYEAGIRYHVIKNTLIRKALEKTGWSIGTFSDTVLHGFSGVLIAEETPNVPAKLIKSFRKESGLEWPIFKGAIVEEATFIGVEQLEVLSQLKSKQELIAEVIGLLQSPVQRVLGALQSGEHTLGGLVKTLGAREAGGKIE